MKLYSNRAGELRHVQSDYDCFVPKSLREVEIKIDDELIDLLSNANRLLGILDGMATTLPDRDLFIAMYVEKEAVVSSQIEGTQASLSDVLQKQSSEKRKDIEEIVNYVHSLNYGIELMDKLPISIRYLKEIHKELLKGVRGENKNPGELRHSQNWIGPMGCTLSNATFVPPTVDLMQEALNDLELYMNDADNLSSLIKIALIHYQFETIHPFLDGNGRLGRLLITLWLKYTKYLQYPLLYLSLFFKQNRMEYYSLLMDVRFKGKYEEWIKFFLKGIIEISLDAIDTINKINKIKDIVFNSINKLTYKNKNTYVNVVDYLFRHPFFNSKDILEEFKLTKPTVSKIIAELVKLGIVVPTSNKQRNVVYKFEKYVDILENGTEL